MVRTVEVSLDSESAMKLIDIVDIVSKFPLTEEMGRHTIVMRAPRAFKFLGTRLVKMEYSVVATDTTRIFIAKAPTGNDSFILLIDLVDTGEGSNVNISATGGGSLSKISDLLEAHVEKMILSAIREREPEVAINSDDTRLASSDIVPVNSYLVYVDSFRPIERTIIEAAFKVLSLFGPGDYIVELSHGDKYLARLVLRKRVITGVYLVEKGRRYTGQQALERGNIPPAHVVRIRAWSLGEPRTAIIYVPEVLSEHSDSRVYVLPGTGVSPTLIPNMVVYDTKYSAAVIDPVFGAKGYRAVRNAIEDEEKITSIVVTSLDYNALSSLGAFKGLPASLYVPPHIGLQLGDVGKLKPKIVRNGEVSEPRMEIIPVGEVPNLSLAVFIPEHRALYTSDSLSCVSPPGMWSLEMHSPDEYASMVRGFGDPRAREALRLALDLGADMIIPRYGPVLRGRENIEKLYNILGGD